MVKPLSKLAPNTFTKTAKLTSAGSIAAFALVAAQPTLADEQPDSVDTEISEGEQRLAELLEGRVAGEPQNCIRTRRNYNLTVIDDTAYVYGRGNTIYVQRTRHPNRIDRDDTLVSRRFGTSQICKQDIVNTIDPLNGFFTGAVFFEEFIPYTRVEEADS